MSQRAEIDMDEAFDIVIKDMKMQMIEYVCENHLDEVLEIIYSKKQNET